MWFLISLIAVALIAGIFWKFKQKLDKRNAESARRFEALLSEVKPIQSPVANGATVATAPVADAPAAAPGAGLGKKPRLLPQKGALLYFVFRAGLPDHEIFANLTLAELIDIEPTVRGFEREQKARRLAQQRLDFVICTRQLEVVAAVIIDAGRTADPMAADGVGFTETCLQAAGIRLLRIDAAAPPRHQQVRDLVYGARQ